MTLLPHSLRILCIFSLILLPVPLLAQTPPLVKPAPEIQALLDQALALRRANKNAEAEPLYAQALKQARAAQDKAGEAAALVGYANFLARNNKTDEALKLSEQARALAHSLPNSLIEAGGWESSGFALYFSGKPQQAIEPFEKARALYHEGGDKADESRAAMALGVMYENTSQIPKAIEIYDQVLPVFRDLKDKLGEANTLTNLALAHQKLDANSKAIADASQALPLYRELKDKSSEANVLHILAMNTLAISDFSKALEVSKESVACAKEAKNPRFEGAALGTLGEIYRTMGQSTLALETYTQALILDRATKNLRSEAATLNNMGIVYSRTGEANKAMEVFQQAITLYEAMGNKQEIASSQLNLGFLCSDMQRYQQAEVYFLAALPFAKETNNQKMIIIILNGLGGVASERGNFAAARKHFQEALALCRSADIKDEEKQAALMGNLGNISLKLNKNNEAFEWYQQSLRLYQKLKIKNGISNIAFSLGEVSNNLNKPSEETKAYFQLAAHEAQSTGNRLYAAHAFYGLATVEQKRRRFAQAEAYSSQAITLLEAIRSGFGGSGTAKSEFLAWALFIYQTHLEILLQQGNYAEAFAFAQKTKARTLLDTLASGRVDLSSVLTEKERQEEQALHDRADSLNQQMVKEGVQNEVGAKKRFAAFKAELRTVESQLQAFTETLYARHPELVRRRVAQTATLAELAPIIPDDTALLDYVILKKKGIAVFVVTTTHGKPKVTAVQIPVSMEALRKQTAAFRLACSDPRKVWKPQSKALYKQLIAPFASSLRGKKRLIVCPDGVLWDVPFAALSKGKQTLWSRYQLTYAYSATGAQAAHLLAQERKSQPAKGSLLVCANPDFGTAKRFGDLDNLPGQRPLSDPSRPISEPARPISDPSRAISIQVAATVPTRGGAIASLAGTQHEADGLKALFPDADILTRKNAQEAKVKANAGNYRYLHFATHGFLNDASPMLSSVVLASPEAGSKEDGFLTAREVYTLNLHAEMTVLSACNTGRGETQKGEGMVGLTWALLCAGCPTQVVSMWSVDDAATAGTHERVLQKPQSRTGQSRCTQSGIPLVAETTKLSPSPTIGRHLW